ncbi:unnamed protein product [Adineta steineri]|uniref:Uncharacterized protein n=1 Tax=Adineta steineri TaxID=433720 RepID=A0A814TH81_9BILA|nr:unnamed protein product [Adineta steineri]
MSEAMIQVMKTVKAAIVGEDPKHLIRYDDPSIEHVEEDEDEKINDIIANFRSMQEKNFEKHEHGLRGTHSKTQAVVKGTLVIPANLPAHLSQGLFRYPGKYPVILRYASEPTQIEDDKIPAPRGLDFYYNKFNHHREALSKQLEELKINHDSLQPPPPRQLLIEKMNDWKTTIFVDIP